MSKELTAALNSITEKIDELDTKVAEASSTRKTGAKPASAPFARRGENIMSSRGFQFSKMLGCVGFQGNILPEDAKIEMDYCARFTRKMIDGGYRPTNNKSVLVPIAPEFFPESLVGRDEYHEMKNLLEAGVHGWNENDDAVWSNHMGRKSAASPALSWVDQSVGGAYVAPPQFGPPIDLLRNKNALMTAGATVVPLGPSGRMIMPRLTAPTSASWSPENNAITPNVPTTGQVELSAKKVMSIVVFPGELLRFGSPATEAIIRNDMMQSVALLADKNFLEGPGGGGVQPLGLWTMASQGGYGVAVISPSGSSQLLVQDIYQFPSAIEENNGEMTSFILRPKMYYSFLEARWLSGSGGVSQGFPLGFTRGIESGFPKNIAGFPATTTAQVSNTVNSTTSLTGGSNTYVIGLNGPDYWIGMFGALEFTQTSEGYNLLSSDQVACRVLLSCDGLPRHPGQVAVCLNTAYTVT